MIRPAKATDAETLSEIYNYYVSSTLVTFEEDTVSSEEMGERIRECMLELPWLVAEDDGEIIGYAYASRWKGRCAYRYSVEVSVYLSHLITSKGWGTSRRGRNNQG